MSKREIDWLLVGRYALLIALTTLIPVPLLDRGVENLLRRRLVRAQADRHGVALDEEAIATLANAPGGGCVGCLWSILMWPIKKVVRTVLIFLSAKQMADLAMEVLHRALMLEEAMELGFLPGDPDRVRVAMDKTLAAVDTRVVERTLLGVFQDHTNDLNRVVWEATRIARADLSEPQRESALADAIEADALGSGAREMTAAMTAALRGTGVVPELMSWFRTELGKGAREVPGLVEPEVLPPDDLPVAALPEPVVEEAEEVKPGDRSVVAAKEEDGGGS